MNERGQTLLETLTVLGLALGGLGWAIPGLQAYFQEAQLRSAAMVFQADFRRARSEAIRSNVQTAIRFEQDGDGTWDYSVYVDGDYDGVRSRDINRGIDVRVAGPYQLRSGAPGVRIGIHPGVSEIPPGRGRLDPSDPIRFGRSNMVSFSPMGTATPGTLYLASKQLQGAVRVTGTTARVRTLVWRGAGWSAR